MKRQQPFPYALIFGMLLLIMLIVAVYIQANVNMVYEPLETNVQPACGPLL